MEILKAKQNDIDTLLDNLRKEEEYRLKQIQEIILEERRIAEEEKLIPDTWKLIIDCKGNFSYNEDSVACGSDLILNYNDIFVDIVKPNRDNEFQEELYFFTICPVCGEFTEIDNTLIPNKIKKEILINLKSNPYSIYSKSIESEPIRKNRKELLSNVESNFVEISKVKSL